MSNDSNSTMEGERTSLGRGTAESLLSEEPRVHVERIGDSGSPFESDNRSAGPSLGGGENDGDENKNKEQETREKRSGLSTENADRPRGNVEVYSQEEAVIRHITFWRNGFQIEGATNNLRPYGDPTSSHILQTIEAGYLFSTCKYINIHRFIFLQWCPGFCLERPSRPICGTARSKSNNRGLYFTRLGGCKGGL